MMHSLKKFIPAPLALLAASSLLVTGCTFVKLSEAGAKVDIRENTSVANCQKLGTISVNGVDNVGFINRSEKKVSNELTIQARNDAAAMGANVLVPLGSPVDGVQKFEAYRCP
ncbi:DUF4156 domain-containing protein [Halioxenophilus sp. WMMB6]|uniref:DUF4156 domain-containing protein n=1 Tax=Halioxenophilus sp. WMMB6 TaxID=3073815 RepID=UPI00295F326E|nr:DUF4156 domain-containing protein [Halioxenophilus sp. WMMB6]